MTNKQPKQDSQTEENFWKELSLLLRLWPFLKKQSWILWIAVALTPLITYLQLLQPYLIKQAIDEHILIGRMEGLIQLGFYYLLAVLGSYVATAIYSIALAYVGQMMLKELRLFLYDRIIRLPLSFFDNKPAGVVLTRITNDVDAIGESIGAGVITAIIDIFMIVGCLSMMFYFHTPMTLMLLLLSPLVLLLVNFMRGKLRILYLQIRESISEVNTHLSEQIDGVDILQFFSAEQQSMDIFGSKNALFRDASKTSNIYDALLFAFVDGIGSVLIGLLLWYATGQLEKNGIFIGDISMLTAGIMVAYIDYMNRLLGPIRDLSSKVAIIQRALAALIKIFHLVDSCEPRQDKGIGISNIRGEIILKNVGFRYSKEGKEILKNINLTVSPGEVIAIVGSSGSGKTTLTRILDGSYTDYKGSITLDGIELSTISLSSLYHHISSVRQDIQLFSQNVHFNLTLNNPNITKEILQDAIQRTRAEDVVQRLGWEQEMKEGGGDVSIGEGQLLTFARMMAHQPTIVILDEATASIDSITENKIQEAIDEIFASKTVIVVAHRLSTIQKANRIVCLEQGEIIEMGTHDELLLQKGRYYELVEAGKSLVQEATQNQSA